MNDILIDDQRELALSRSKFRTQFQLEKNDIAYLHTKGMSVVRAHAKDFVEKRLAPMRPKKDGKQTPFRGHPVFKAQHATATCCRGCLNKWYGISKDTKLSTQQITGVADIIMHWIEKQYLLHCQSEIIKKGEKR